GAITAASSASLWAARIRPLFTKKYPPGSAKAFTSSESITRIVNGTLASEFFTMFWATRFTYSSITGSCTIFDDFITCCAICAPHANSVLSEYQLPMPRRVHIVDAAFLYARHQAVRTTGGRGVRDICFWARWLLLLL